MKTVKETPLVQLDLELCEDSPCWRFSQEAEICINCPWKKLEVAQFKAGQKVE